MTTHDGSPSGVPAAASESPSGGQSRADQRLGEAPASGEGVGSGRIGTLAGLLRTYRCRILFTYGLFNLENLLVLAQPYVLGLAMNDLLRRSYRGLVLFVLQHLSHLLVASWRRMYDARAFTGIYADLAGRLVLEQRGRNVGVSRVAARAALSRELVAFFERDVPAVVHGLYCVAGALVMLALYDQVFVVLGLALFLPAAVVTWVYARKSFWLNGRLNDQLEQEVEAIRCGHGAEVRDHYLALARWQVKLSDWEAIHFGVMEGFILGLMAVVLQRCCTAPGAALGDIFAVFRYVLMFVVGLDNLPALVRQVTRLCDIGQRLQPDTSDLPPKP